MTNLAPTATGSLQPVADASQLTEGIRELDRVIAAFGVDRLLAELRAKYVSDELAAALRQVCDEARAATNGGAERMVIALHAAWPRLPAVRGLSQRHTRDALLACIIALLIAEFYAPTRRHGDVADA